VGSRWVSGGGVFFHTPLERRGEHSFDRGPDSSAEIVNSAYASTPGSADISATVWDGTSWTNRVAAVARRSGDTSSMISVPTGRTRQHERSGMSALKHLSAVRRGGQRGLQALLLGRRELDPTAPANACRGSGDVGAGRARSQPILRLVRAARGSIDQSRGHGGTCRHERIEGGTLRSGDALTSSSRSTTARRIEDPFEPGKVRPDWS